MQILRLIIAGLLVIFGLSAAPVLVIVQGNFGPSDSAATVFDNQAYSMSFLIPNPADPDQEIAAPDLTFFSVTYLVPGSLSVPGIGLSTTEPVQLQFISQVLGETASTWMNVFSFQNIPVGDFIVVTPIQTLNGTALWNGQAAGFGIPELSPLDHEPAFAFIRLQQVPPGEPSIPLANYQEGTASITIIQIPEPSTTLLFGIGAAFIAGYCAAQRRRRARQAKP